MKENITQITKKEIEHILKNYFWMMNSIKMMYESLQEIGSKTAAYGIEATMPKAQGQTGDPVFADVVRRSKYWKRIEEYEKKVKAIQDRIHLITDDREVEVLNWILEGKGYSWIARHMGLSERHIRRLRDSVVEQLVENMPNMPKTSENKAS